MKEEGREGGSESVRKGGREGVRVRGRVHIWCSPLLPPPPMLKLDRIEMAKAHQKQSEMEKLASVLDARGN